MNSIDFAQLQLWLSGKFLDVTNETSNKEWDSEYWRGYSQALIETMKYARQEVENVNADC